LCCDSFKFRYCSFSERFDFEIISEADSDIGLTTPDERTPVIPVIKTEISMNFFLLDIDDPVVDQDIFP